MYWINHEYDIILSKLQIWSEDIMRFTKSQIKKLKSNFEYCWDQETASRFNKKTW
jgi:hypothetical protein